MEIDGNLILNNIKDLEKSLEDKNKCLIDLLKEMDDLHKQLKSEKESFRKTKVYRQMSYNKYKETYKKNYKYVKKIKE